MEPNTIVIPSGNAIRTVITKGPITVDSVGVNNPEFQKEGFESAQLRQVIKSISYYPAKKVTSNMHDNLFSNDELGIKEQEFESEENRVTWMDVAIGTTVEQVTKRIADVKTATLYKILSNKPIITDNQENAIARGFRTMDDFANTQAVRYPEGVTKSIGGVNTDVSGTLVLDNNDKIQYRRVFLSKVDKADIDLRNDNIADMYLSPELMEELGGAAHLAEQTI